MTVKRMFLLLLNWLALCVTFVALGSAQTYSALYDFQSSGIFEPEPFGQMAFDPAGNIYGTTYYGGTNGCGTVYQMAPPMSPGGSWTETTLYSFGCSADGANPYGGIAIDRSSNLYGTTMSKGGTRCQCGTVFELKPPSTPGGTWGFRTIHHFGGAPNDGQFPQTSLALDSSGNVYGTTPTGGTFDGSNAGGTAFKLSPSGSGWTETILWNFGGADDASFVLSGLVGDSSGNFYGTSQLGGVAGVGTVFELSPPAGGSTAWAETVLYNFPGANSGSGEYPEGSLLIDFKGHLFGTATGSTEVCCGSIFKLTPPSNGATWSFKTLFTFSQTTDGYGPVGLSMDASAQNLFGITYEGKIRCCGDGPVAYKLTPPGNAGGSWTYSVLYHFGTKGAGPRATPLVDKSSNVYGTVPNGGTYNGGVLYEITP